MKKIFAIAIVAMFAFVSNTYAQWEKPVEQQEEQPKKRGLLDRNKVKTIDRKYLAGGVPEVDGKVMFSREISAPGKTASQLYDILLPYFQKFVKEENQLQNSQVAVVNKESKQIGVRAIEWLVFENRPLSLDRTKLNYTLIAQCKDGGCDIKIVNISYKYEEDRPSAMNVTAEEWITDKEALNKKGDGFRKGVRKFRMHTIDRMEQILNGVEEAVK